MNATPLKPRKFFHARRRFANRLLYLGTILATLLALAPLFAVLYYLLRQGLPALNWAFFTHMPKPPGELGGGMANAIVGTVELVALASIVGLPLGILGGIYLAEFGNNNTGTAIRFTADVLASVPSIVIGIFVSAIAVLPFKHYSALAGGLALGIMMVPTVMRTTDELVKMVPMSQREAALSLGVTHFRTVFTVIIAAARAGVITGVLLAVARVAGETAPLLFTAFGNMHWNLDPTKPIASLPVQVFNYAIAPYDDWHAQAWAGALVLVAMVLVLSIAARFATRGKLKMVR